MKKITINGDNFTLPTDEEWTKLINGQIKDIEGIGVLNNKLIKDVIEYAQKKKELNTTKTLGALELRTLWNNSLWHPTILYFPNGFPIVVDKNTDDSNETYFRVHFRMFHCFDCNIDVDGYALDKDSYISKNEELKKVYKAFDFFKLKCPKCNGSMRSPGLVEIRKIYD